MMEPLPPDKVYRFIEPGPVVLVTTAQGKERPNVMAMSYHMVVDDGDPPLIACMLGPWDYSYRAFRATGECVIAVPTVDLAAKVVAIGNCSGADTDKFEAFGLTALPAKKVKAPLIAECLANFECRIKDDNPLEGYNMFILEVVAAWVDPERKERRVIHHRGNGTFVVDGRVLDLKKKMTRWPTYTRD